MLEFIRIVLLLGIAGAAATFVASGAAWWMDEERRLYRIAKKVLDGKPDAMIVAVGRNAAAAFRLASRQVLVMSDGGAHALLYVLYNLVGAELIVDDEVVARVSRDQAKKSLDQVAAGARQVTLRLLFDDPRHPDFDLDLWQPRDEHRNEHRTAAAVIREARAWLGRCEAIMRRSEQPQAAAAAVAPVRPAPVELAPEPEPVDELLPWEGDSEFDAAESEEEEDFDPSEHPRLL